MPCRGPILCLMNTLMFTCVLLKQNTPNTIQLTQILVGQREFEKNPNTADIIIKLYTLY